MTERQNEILDELHKADRNLFIGDIVELVKKKTGCSNADIVDAINASPCDQEETDEG